MYRCLFEKEQLMNHFANLPAGWKKPEHFCYDLVDVHFVFGIIIDDTSQTRTSKF